MKKISLSPKIFGALTILVFVSVIGLAYYYLSSAHGQQAKISLDAAVSFPVDI